MQSSVAVAHGIAGCGSVATHRRASSESPWAAGRIWVRGVALFKTIGYMGGSMSTNTRTAGPVGGDWFIATHRGWSVTQPGLSWPRRIKRSGQRFVALSPGGFTVYQRPADISADAMGPRWSMPWVVWRVRPIGELGRYEPDPTAIMGAELRCRTVVIAERMPAGYEFGPYGSAVHELLDRMQATPEDLRTLAGDEYRSAARTLRDSVRMTPEQRCIAQVARWRYERRGATLSEHRDLLLTATITGTPIPPLLD